MRQFLFVKENLSYVKFFPVDGPLKKICQRFGENKFPGNAKLFMYC